jgi:hypothetical protein
MQPDPDLVRGPDPVVYWRNGPLNLCGDGTSRAAVNAGLAVGSA